MGSVDRAAALLRQKADNAQVKMLGLSEHFAFLASALTDLQALDTALVERVAQLDRRMDALAPAREHASACECRACCLARLVAHDSPTENPKP